MEEVLLSAKAALAQRVQKTMNWALESPAWTIPLQGLLGHLLMSYALNNYALNNHAKLYEHF